MLTACMLGSYYPEEAPAKGCLMSLSLIRRLLVIVLALLPRARRSALVQGTAFSTPVRRKRERSKFSTGSVWAANCRSLPGSRGDATEGSWPSGAGHQRDIVNKNGPGRGWGCAPLCPSHVPPVSPRVPSCPPTSCPVPPLSTQPSPALAPGLRLQPAPTEPRWQKTTIASCRKSGLLWV